MKLIIAVDENRGLSYRSRRVSRDRFLNADIIESLDGSPLYIEKYSEYLFRKYKDADIRTFASDDEVPDDASVFIEISDPSRFVKKCDTIVIYYWNRNYPSDAYFKMNPEEKGYALTEVYDFEGYSHEDITREVYRKL